MKTYLGDSVYAEFVSDYYVKLTTENGYATDPSNTIFLEPPVYKNLLDFVERLKEEKSVSVPPIVGVPWP